MLELLHKIDKEYRIYKESVIKKLPEEIWNDCHKIYFYISLHEYFTYNQNIPQNVITSLNEYDNIIAECWQLYIKREELSFVTWKDIAVLVEQCLEYLKSKTSKMSFSEFEQKICEELLKRMDNVKIQAHNVVKNNSTELKAITIMEDGCNVSPSIYLEMYYEDYINGTGIEDITDRIIEVYNQNRYKGNFKVEELLSWDKMNSKIVCRFINKEKNEELLKYIPYVRWCDLAIVFNILLNADTNEMATVRISKTLLKYWDKSLEELIYVAAKNTITLFPPTYNTLSNVIEKILGSRELICDYDDKGSIVISNIKMLNGAIVLLYPDILTKVAEKLQSDFYIIPSSVHEVIAVAASLCNPSDLLDMVNEVNTNVVPKTEFLSDNIYYYDRNTHILRMFSKNMPDIEINMEQETLFRI